MKRQVTAEKPTPIKAPRSPRSIENEMTELTDFMIQQMAKRFQNQVLGKIQVSTVEKFADSASARHTYTFTDAQTGNFAAVLLRLSKAAKRSLLKQFSNARIESISQQVLSKLDKRAKREFYERVAAKTGINVADLIAKEGMKATTNALMLETAQWIQTLRDETFQKFTNNTLFAMSQGESLDAIVNQFDDIVIERKSHAKFLARNQVQNYNSITTKIRAQNLSITRAVWQTSGDERVRPSHADRDGKEYDIAEGLYSSVDGKHLIPGLDFSCRCTALYVIPETPEE